MTIKFLTENGSLYELDSEKMTWRRTKADTSGIIRAESGELINWPEIEVGKSACMFDTSVLPGCLAHAVITSPIVEIIPSIVN